MRDYDKELAEARKLWPEGPWTSEPDRVEFEAKGLPALIVRSRLGNLCGYVAVPPGHPAHGKDHDSVPVNVHGGLTYSARCGSVICHKAKPGEPDDVWWLGFDCAHAFDVVPGLRALYQATFDGETYKDMAFVKAECEKLAAQLLRMRRRRRR